MAKEAVRDILTNPGSITPEALQVLTRTEQQARGLGHDYIGTEHLLLSLLQGNSHAAIILKSLGIDPEEVRAVITHFVGHGSKAPTSSDIIPFTPGIKKVVKIADQMALDRHKELDTEELLLGLMRDGESVGAGIIEYFIGRSKDRIAAAVRTQFPPSQISTLS